MVVILVVLVVQIVDIFVVDDLLFVTRYNSHDREETKLYLITLNLSFQPLVWTLMESAKRHFVERQIISPQKLFAKRFEQKKTYSPKS